MACDLMITWLEPDYQSLRKVEDMNDVRKRLPSSVILQVLLRSCQETFGVTCVGKTKTQFFYRINNYKSKHRSFRKSNQKVLQKPFQAHYYLDGHSGIDDSVFVKFQQCETYDKLKETETF